MSNMDLSKAKPPQAGKAVHKIGDTWRERDDEMDSNARKKARVLAVKEELPLIISHAFLEIPWMNNYLKTGRVASSGVHWTRSETLESVQRGDNGKWFSYVLWVKEEAFLGKSTPNFKRWLEVKHGSSQGGIGLFAAKRFEKGDIVTIGLLGNGSNPQLEKHQINQFPESDQLGLGIKWVRSLEGGTKPKWNSVKANALLMNDGQVLRAGSRIAAGSEILLPSVQTKKSMKGLDIIGSVVVDDRKSRVGRFQDMVGYVAAFSKSSGLYTVQFANGNTKHLTRSEVESIFPLTPINYDSKQRFNERDTDSFHKVMDTGIASCIQVSL